MRKLLPHPVRRRGPAGVRGGARERSSQGVAVVAQDPGEASGRRPPRPPLGELEDHPPPFDPPRAGDRRPRTRRDRPAVFRPLLSAPDEPVPVLLELHSIAQPQTPVGRVVGRGDRVRQLPPAGEVGVGTYGSRPPAPPVTALLAARPRLPHDDLAGILVILRRARWPRLARLPRLPQALLLIALIAASPFRLRDLRLTALHVPLLAGDPILSRLEGAALLFHRLHRGLRRSLPPLLVGDLGQPLL